MNRSRDFLVKLKRTHNPEGRSHRTRRTVAVRALAGTAISAALWSCTLAADVNIWRVDLRDADPGARQPRQFLASKRDSEPDFSPDGTRIAFMSLRTGFPEIWMCARDGTNPVALTSFRGPFVHRPRWSPDGQRITFYADAKGNRDIFVLAPGEVPKQITDHRSRDTNPEWSRNGQWIYFISDRTGKGQTTWKISANGGDAIPIAGITDVVQESFDGLWLYHLRVSPRRYEIWRLPAGGAEAGRYAEAEQYVDATNPSGGWKVVEDGVYFIGLTQEDGTAPIQFKRFQTGKVETLARTLRRPGFGLALSPDRKTILFAQWTH